MATSDGTALVGVLLPRPDAAAAIVACWERGEAVLPLDPDAPTADRDRILATLRPTHVLTPDGRRGHAGGVPVAAGTAAVVATSGTTGRRKGAVLTHAGLAASGRAVAEALGADAPGGARPGSAPRAAAGGPEWLCCLPVHYVAGLAVVGRAWVTGTRCTVHPRFDVAAVSGAADHGGLVSLVPTMLRRLLDAGAPVGRFRAILLGGGTIDPALRAEAEAAGATVHATYGMTETWGGVVHDGRPLPGVELRLAGDRAGPAGTPAEILAEILIRGPMVMAGYRLWPEGTAAAIDAEGWYHTGDLGRLEADTGLLRFVDRMGDMVNSGGVKVSPIAVERVLATHSGVADVAVAGRSDPEWGEVVAAFVVPADPSDPPDLAGLAAHVRAVLPAAFAPRHLELVAGIPRSEGGKILRRRLAGAASAPAPP